VELINEFVMVAGKAVLVRAVFITVFVVDANEVDIIVVSTVVGATRNKRGSNRLC
jgi:hypothetical protein